MDFFYAFVDLIETAMDMSQGEIKLVAVHLTIVDKELR
jgi:hypothetical protein